MPVTRLLLIRHGHSAAQETGLVTDHDTCAGLSDTGRLQVQRLSARLSRSGELEDVDIVFTSLLARAQQTAAAVADGLGVRAVRRDCSFCELHPGEADG